MILLAVAVTGITVALSLFLGYLLGGRSGYTVGRLHEQMEVLPLLQELRDTITAQRDALLEADRTLADYVPLTPAEFYRLASIEQHLMEEGHEDD